MPEIKTIVSNIEGAAFEGTAFCSAFRATPCHGCRRRRREQLALNVELLTKKVSFPGPKANI